MHRPKEVWFFPNLLRSLAYIPYMGPTEGREGDMDPTKWMWGPARAMAEEEKSWSVSSVQRLLCGHAGQAAAPCTQSVSAAAGKRARCSRSPPLANLSCACCQNALPARTWSIALLIKSLARTSTRFQRRGLPG